MGPMGPMMGGVTCGAAWFFLVLVVLVVVVLAVVAGLGRGGRTEERQRPRSPEAILRERYARGELTPRQYREALVEVLKDRYVRDELTLDEYEARLQRLLEEPRASVPEGVASGGPPRPPDAGGARQDDRA